MRLIGLALMASIFLGVLAVGMRVVPGDLQYLWSRPSRLARSLLAMNVLAPIVVVLVCRTFSLHAAVVVALVTLSIAPVGALFPQTMLPLVAPLNASYGRGLFFTSTVLSVVLTPLAVEVIDVLFAKDVHVSPMAVAQVVIRSVLLPLGVGLAIGRWWSAAKRWIPAIQKVSSLVLGLCFLAIIAVAWSQIGAVVHQGTLTALVVITLIWLAVGHLLGGPDEDDRTVLAFATASRHPGVALAVASLTGEPLAPIGVLLAVIVRELTVVPYKRWRKRLRAGRSAVMAHPPTGAH
jgi:predicted Na+-dependent transporter